MKKSGNLSVTPSCHIYEAVPVTCRHSALAKPLVRLPAGAAIRRWSGSALRGHCTRDTQPMPSTPGKPARHLAQGALRWARALRAPEAHQSMRRSAWWSSAVGAEAELSRMQRCPPTFSSAPAKPPLTSRRWCRLGFWVPHRDVGTVAQFEVGGHRHRWSAIVYYLFGSGSTGFGWGPGSLVA